MEFCVDIFLIFFLLSFSSLNMFDHLHAIMVSGEKSVIHNFRLYVMCCLYYLRLSSVLTSSSLSLCLFLSLLLSFCSFSPSSSLLSSNSVPPSFCISIRMCLGMASFKSSLIGFHWGLCVPFKFVNFFSKSLFHTSRFLLLRPQSMLNFRCCPTGLWASVNFILNLCSFYISSWIISIVF